MSVVYAHMCIRVCVHVRRFIFAQEATLSVINLNYCVRMCLHVLIHLCAGNHAIRCTRCEPACHVR